MNFFVRCPYSEIVVAEKPKKRRNKHRRKSTYVEKNDVEYLSIRNKKILLRFTELVLMVIAIACAAIVLAFGYDFSTVHIHDVAANWSLPAVRSVEFRSPSEGCGYPEDYPGFDYFGYEYRTIKGVQHDFFYKVWKGQLICLYPLENSSGGYITASSYVAPVGGACPATHPLNCGISGCFDTDQCPIARIEFSEISPSLVTDSKTQFCHSGAGTETCYQMTATPSRTMYPLVEISSNAQQNVRPLMCSSDYARKPHDGFLTCDAASSTFFRFDVALESNEISLLADNNYSLLITNDLVFTRARPAIYYRNSIRFGYDSCDVKKIDNYIIASENVENKADSAKGLAIAAFAAVVIMGVYILGSVSLNVDHRAKDGGILFGIGLPPLIVLILLLITAIICFVLCGICGRIIAIISPILADNCVIGETKDNLMGAFNNASIRFALALVAGIFTLLALAVYAYSATLVEAKKNLPEGETEEAPVAALHPFEIRPNDED